MLAPPRSPHIDEKVWSFSKATVIASSEHESKEGGTVLLFPVPGVLDAEN